MPHVITRAQYSTAGPGALCLAGLVLLIGGVSLAATAWFLFQGPLHLVDLGLGSTAGLGLDLDLGLCLIFFLQHSIMIRRSFKQWLAGWLQPRFFGAVYTIASGLVLLALVVFWQESSQILGQPPTLIRWLIHGVFLAAAGLMAWGVLALALFDAFGLEGILRSERRSPQGPPRLTVRGPYLWVRHPLYLSALVMVWACPVMSLDRMLFNVLWSAWIVVATRLEERDLALVFGADYRQYQAQVPMLIPWPR